MSNLSILLSKIQQQNILYSGRWVLRGYSKLFHQSDALKLCCSHPFVRLVWLSDHTHKLHCLGLLPNPWQPLPWFTCDHPTLFPQEHPQTKNTETCLFLLFTGELHPLGTQSSVCTLGAASTPWRGVCLVHFQHSQHPTSAHTICAGRVCFLRFSEHQLYEDGGTAGQKCILHPASGLLAAVFVFCLTTSAPLRPKGDPARTVAHNSSGKKTKHNYLI